MVPNRSFRQACSRPRLDLRPTRPSCARCAMRRRAASLRSPRRRSTKRRWRSPASPGADTPRCWPTLTHAQRVAMMFWSEKLRVVLATIHIPLARVPSALTIESVMDIIDLTLPRAAALRHSAPASRAGWPEPARGRARCARDRRIARARTCGCTQREGGHRHRRPVSRRYRSFCVRCEASSTP